MHIPGSKYVCPERFSGQTRDYVAVEMLFQRKSICTAPVFDGPGSALCNIVKFIDKKYTSR